jgi:hypothetical protein
MTDLALSHAKTAASRRYDANTSGKSAGKKFSAFISCNPLKSLDSDERIQGNPNESNSSKAGLSQRNGEAPRKSKSAGVAVRCREGSKPNPFKWRAASTSNHQ